MPLSGPLPVTNKIRRRQLFDIDGRPWPAATAPLVNTASSLRGDYGNPILKPAAAELVKKRGENEQHGIPNASARNQCWPEGLPAIFRDMTIVMLPQADQITILYDFDHEVRHVRMNQTHPAEVTPSWYGDSIGHYEGDTLVVDTVGIKLGRYSMVDWYGTPHTAALHVIERYRMLDYDDAKDGFQRDAKEHNVVPGKPVPNADGKYLQLRFTV